MFDKLIESYMFTRGNRSQYYASHSADRKGSVLLVHGLLVRAYYMEFLMKHFIEAGYDVYNYDYPSSTADIATHGENLRREIERILAQMPMDEPLHVVTHSMGGILVRYALGNASDEILKRMGNVVMLAPPNRGSYWPNVLRYIIPGVQYLNRSILDLRDTEDSPLRKIPPFPPKICLGIISGRWDDKVTIEQTHLNDCDCEYYEVTQTHMTLCFSTDVFEKILYFVQHGTFQKS